MTINERFKHALQSGNFDNAIEIALTEAMSLEIVTWVADDEEDTENETGRAESSVRKPRSQICTKINLLDGKVENQIGSLFLDGGPYANLRAFHTQQVEASQELIEKKITSLQILKDAWLTAKPESPFASGLGERDRAEKTQQDLAPSKIDLQEIPFKPSEARLSSEVAESSNIELILGNLFNPPFLPESNLSSTKILESDDQRMGAHLQVVHNGYPITSTSVDLQIDLSIDDLLADLFNEQVNQAEDESLATENSNQDDRSDRKSASPVSDPWVEQDFSQDLNAIPERLPESPKL